MALTPVSERGRASRGRGGRGKWTKVGAGDSHDLLRACASAAPSINVTRFKSNGRPDE